MDKNIVFFLKQAYYDGNHMPVKQSIIKNFLIILFEKLTTQNFIPSFKVKFINL